MPVAASRAAWIEGELRYDEATLTALAQTPSGVYKVAARGRVVDDGKVTVPFFDHRYCTFIYRLPT